ncbi:Sodium- and chloride-dependent neutral and basic amino acid transporter B(0+),Sodium- and chloride-dependent taurine transporter,Sodium-dependent noradrenaline transporter,Sodium-dependent nutrient amino acid transporter 1,Sodium-dependent proline transporter,Sodium-and chloride-dependent glycine transporter 1,Creatine transporter,Sodium- and chloride-dependent GABA transporter 3,Sodium- and chloride-dependent betaine transporter,Sodium- and chloride-dependent GABA transporter 2,Sodium-dependent dopamine t|uniref:Transporter n=1 Tax=Mytilus coruscus TaxID=42192 RepID=A0A6J8DC83_MYTCO|nr:Sodium- and chloride-dependent neutral and basic amino acid transporter B(0+),Sodium- and chloride-dependent taurine transporter,Sodium-dependent noradrenaline transporter,Sodium-dependent nutrient amino acid transporter 1,Sodium-dependent proline transporter,Sodium-and chloride-dependent glycine transporter 1,Creatine transporter,Sodium- and chloride-dependent GABA transporter 3,Sodium- and chloride-dependent betaine transporter,Sodium- and chloride-dependent GABA transporter 2,Sodium-dependent
MNYAFGIREMCSLDLKANDIPFTDETPDTLLQIVDDVNSLFRQRTGIISFPRDRQRTGRDHKLSPETDREMVGFISFPRDRQRTGRDHKLSPRQTENRSGSLAFPEKQNSLQSYPSYHMISEIVDVKENTTEKQNEDRENWSGRLDFIMSCIGYSVGIGNIWRFPYLCYKNGGGAFLIPYLLFMVVGAVPIFFLEYAVAQFSSSSTLTVWKICPLMKGVGYGALLVSAIFCVYFNIFMTWTLYFLYQSMTSVLPWSHCNNEWNTENCLDSSRYNASISNVSKEGNWSMSKNLTKMTASEEYWK